MRDKPVGKRKYPKTEITKRNAKAILEVFLDLADEKITTDNLNLKSNIKVEWINDRQLFITGEQKRKYRTRYKTIDIGIQKKDILIIVEQAGGKNIEVGNRHSINNKKDKKINAIQNALFHALIDLNILEEKSTHKNQGYRKFKLNLVHQSQREKNLNLIEERWEAWNLPIEKQVYLPLSPSHLVENLRSQACKNIKDLYSKIRLLNGDLIDVDRLYVDVYLLNRPANKYRATIEDLLKVDDIRESFDRLGLAERGKRSEGMTVVQIYTNLMILGKPGSGKTTFLRHIGVACAKAEFLNDYIPILIEFREVQNYNPFSLLDEISLKLKLAREQTEKIIDENEFLILLDGLDETPSQSRSIILDNINEFSRKYSKNRFIITCRTQTSEYYLPNFQYLEVADFNKEQVEQFANNWFSSSDRLNIEEQNKLTENFIEQLKASENKQIAELAVTPILLSLTCWIFIDRKIFPDKRSQLYQEGIELLLRTWDRSRGIVRRDLEIKNYQGINAIEKYQKMIPLERQRLLGYIAFYKFKDKQYALFDKDEISEYLAEYLKLKVEEVEEVPAIIESQHGLLVERAKGIYSFSHLTLQEFLTAQYISKDYSLVRDLVQNYITDTRWREVFLLLAELRGKNADELLLAMEEKIHSYINTDKLQALLAWTDAIVDPSPSVIKLVCKRAIAIQFANANASANASANVYASAYAHTKASANVYASAYASANVYASAYASAAKAAKAANAYGFAYAKAAYANANAYANASVSNAANAANAYVEMIAKLTVYKNVQFDSLLFKLKNLKEKSSNKNLSRESIKEQLDKLFQTLLEGFNLTEQMIDLSNEEFKSLENYFYAAKLMLDCKNAAVRVSQNTWDQIESRMLKPKT